MRHFLLLVFVGLLMAGASHAQDISFYGFIKSETIHDTRQVAQEPFTINGFIHNAHLFGR